MFQIKKEGVILDTTVLEFENEGVLNPAIMQEGDAVHMFYRAVRKGNYSTIGYARFDGPLTLAKRNDTPLLNPVFDYESHGIEDPRIVKIENLYYMTFTAYDGANALGALATSEDLIHFDRQGLIVPLITHEKFLNTIQHSHLNKKYKRFYSQTHTMGDSPYQVLLFDKNLILFPRKIKGKFYFLHRIHPDIQIASVNTIEELNETYWANYFLHFENHILMTAKHEHEISYIGGGCPPIETKDGWLLIYHGVHDSTDGYIYSACAALLDLDDPRKEIARLPYPLFRPELAWELNGEVNNVVFPTGTSLFGDTLYIYYGAADTRIAVASGNLSELITELLTFKT